GAKEREPHSFGEGTRRVRENRDTDREQRDRRHGAVTVRTAHPQDRTDREKAGNEQPLDPGQLVAIQKESAYGDDGSGYDRKPDHDDRNRSNVVPREQVEGSYQPVVSDLRTVAVDIADSVLNQSGHAGCERDVVQPEEGNKVPTENAAREQEHRKPDNDGRSNLCPRRRPQRGWGHR